MKSIVIINGPNLNLLGSRQPEIYGNQTFESYFEQLKGVFPEIELVYFQSNHEGELVSTIQDANTKHDGIVLNAAAYTHTSVAIADAVSAIQAPVIEVHISYPEMREDYRKTSLLSDKCAGTISGLGLVGYQFAIEVLIDARSKI